MEQHELSKAFPSMSDEEFQDLKDDIENVGVLNPITLFEGKVLDGWHRYTACKELGITCPSVELPAHISPMEFVLSQNKMRRHMTKAQLAHSASQCYQAWYGRPRNDGQQGGEGTSPFSEKSNKNNDLIFSNSEQKSKKAIAEMIGVAPRTVQQARKVIRECSQEVNDAVRDGKIGLEKAIKISRLPKDRQAEAIYKPIHNIHGVSEAEIEEMIEMEIDDLDFQKLYEEQLELNNSLIKDDKDIEIKRLNELLQIEKQANIGLQNQLKSLDQRSRLIGEMFRKISQYLKIDHPKEIWRFISSPELALSFYRSR